MTFLYWNNENIYMSDAVYIYSERCGSECRVVETAQSKSQYQLDFYPRARAPHSLHRSYSLGALPPTPMMRSMTPKGISPALYPL